MTSGSDTPTIETQALAALAIDLAGCPAGCLRFFAALFASPDPLLKVHPRLSIDMGVGGSTLMSRFARAGLPAPKAYVLGALFVRLRGAHEANPRPLVQLANSFDASSPQSLGRTVRQATGLTLSEFLAAGTAIDQLAVFRESLVASHIEKLRTFSPYAGVAR